MKRWSTTRHVMAFSALIAAGMLGCQDAVITIANELTQHIQGAAQAEATDQAAASKNHLEEFRTVVQSLPPDQIDTAAAQTLKEDADYLIGADDRGEND